LPTLDVAVVSRVWEGLTITRPRCSDSHCAKLSYRRSCGSEAVGSRHLPVPYLMAAVRRRLAQGLTCIWGETADPHAGLSAVTLPGQSSAQAP
jgi:hypothetical protein